MIIRSAFICLLFSLATSLTGQDFSVYDLDSLKADMEDQGGPWLGFLHNDNLVTGLYRLHAGEEDVQTPHEKDEVYFVIEGRAQFQCDGEVIDVYPGVILFVAAEAEHSFLDIQQDLLLLVFFD